MQGRPKILRDDGIEEELPDGFQVEEYIRTPSEVSRAWTNIIGKKTQRKRHRRTIRHILDKP